MSKAIDKATVDGYNVDSGLKAIGLTNQRETTVVWSKSTAFHLYNAIVWMDVRTSSILVVFKPIPHHCFDGSLLLHRLFVASVVVIGSIKIVRLQATPLSSPQGLSPPSSQPHLKPFPTPLGNFLCCLVVY